MKEAKDMSSHWRKILEMPYINGSELVGDVLVTIKEYKTENFFSPSKKRKEDHAILYFNELKKGMVVNSRKAQAIERILGTPLMEEWVGKTLTIFSQDEKHFGIVYPVITVKRGEKKKSVLTPEHKRWNVAVEKIASGETDMKAIKKSFQVSKVVETKLMNEVELLKASKDEQQSEK